MVKNKVLLVGIAGTTKDFLLSLPSLKSFVYQDEEIRERYDINIKQYPIDADKRKIIQDIKNISPNLIGFSCYTWNIDSVREIAKEVSGEVILGGPEITREGITGGKFNDFPANFLVFGEGEKPFYNFLKGKREEKGIAQRKGNSFLCSREDDLIERLDEIPSPYLEGFVDEEIFSREGIRANIESQRGCNFRCAYCFYHKNFPRIRYRNPDIVAKEIEHVFKKGVKSARIVDANFLSDRKYTKKIIGNLIDKKIEMSIFLEAHPMFIEQETANLFKDYVGLSNSNRIIVGMGIQTTNQESLAIIRRKIPIKYFERAFDLMQWAGAIVKSDIILGLPRETKKTYYETLEYISEKMRYKKNFLNPSLLRVLPGTDMVEIAKREGMVVENGAEHYVYSTPTLSRGGIVECLRMNSVAFRLLSTEDIKKKMKTRDLYFQTKDKLEATNIQMLEYFEREFLKYLKNKDSDFIKKDFPNAEDYCFRKVYSDIPDEWLIKGLKKIKEKGLK